MTSTTPSRKSSKGGRPASGTLEQRLEQLLEAATRVFLKDGYGSTSIDMIAREARVAKRTIYQYFGDKDELFGAVIRRLSSNVLASFPDVEEGPHAVEQTLAKFAHQLLNVVLTPEAVGLERLVIGEASRFPELAKQFYNNGPARGIAALAQYLAIQKQVGTIKVEDPAIAAEYFFNLALGEVYRRAVLGIGNALSLEQSKKHVDSVIHSFLYGGIDL